MPTPRSLAFALAAAAACGEVHPQPAVDGGVDGGPDAATDAIGAEFGLALEHTAITAPRSIGVEVDVMLTRAGVDGDVVVTLGGLAPTGVTAAALTIPAGSSTGTFVIDLDATVALATSALVIEARPAVGAALAAGTLALTTSATAPGFELAWVRETTWPRRSLWTVPGWTSSPMIHAEARNGYAASVQLRWSGLPAGLTGVAPAITVDSSWVNASLPLVAAATAAPGPAVLRLTGSDGTFRQQVVVDLTVAPAPALDRSVGVAGRLVIDQDASFQPIALDLDSLGRPIAMVRQIGGSVRLIRYTSAGAVDLSYGTAGVASPFAVGVFDEVTDGLVGQGDAVVMIGVGASRIRAARVTAAGIPDPSFDGDGVAILAGPAEEYPFALRLRGGKLVIAARSDGHAAILRVNADGSLDPTFDADGRTSLSLGSQFHDLAFDAQGRIVAAGIVDATGTGVVARFTATGQLDPTFGTGGVVTIAAPGAAATELNAIVEAGNGDLVLAGTTRHATGSRGLLVRLAATGAPVQSFGTNGFRTVQLATDGLEEIELTKIRYSPLGITGFGNRMENDGSLRHSLLVRVDETGAAVPSFGPGGAEWQLGGEPIELFAGARATLTGIWVLAMGTEAESIVLMRTTAGL